MAASKNTQGKANGTLLAWRTNSKRRVDLNYGSCDTNTLQRAIDRITRNGGAVMFGLTSDGGAYSVVVLYKDEKLKEYPSSTEQLEGLLEDLAEQFQEPLA